MRFWPAVSLALFIGSVVHGQANVPKDKVPDSETAVRIGEAALIPVYGKKQIQSEEPFQAELKGDVWTVHGTLHCPDGKGGTTTNCVGGVAGVKISKSKGRILSMIHYK
jgi:hypothetical protein